MHVFHTALYYLISWPKEGDAMSVVSGKAIVSPPAEKLKEGCMCKVKCFENNPAKVIAARTKAEMNSKLNELDGDHSDDTEPKKKARVEGKENKNTPKAKQKRRPKNQKEPGTYKSYFYWVHWCVRGWIRTCTMCICVCIF